MTRPVSHSAPRQRGAVLIVSLILLVVLTLLGVSVMNMTQLEERMASNIQELNQAFHSAETGLSQAYDDINNWNPNADIDVALTPIPSTNHQVGYTVSFLVSTDPPPGNDKTLLRTHNFNVRAISVSGSNYTSTLHGGGYVVGKPFADPPVDDGNQLAPPPAPP
jgi:type IV pilus assembly protein PilX